MPNPPPCPFCSPNPANLIHQDHLVLALFALLDRVRQHLDDQHHPNGYNIGINENQAAGQTVPHLHIHLIPRYTGDVSDPTGGVRFVIPDKANYLQSRPDPTPVTPHLPHHDALVTGIDDPLLPHLLAHLDLAHQVDIAIAFTMVSGLKLIYERLKDLLQRGGTLRFLTGDYLDVTEPGALRRLLDLTDPNRPGPELRIFHAADQSFHPKAYIFRQENGSATAIVGSSNLSATALGPGVEWSYRVITSRDQAGFARASDAFEQLFSHPATATRSSNRPSTPSGVSVPAPTQALDYLVMHEFHHAAANTYRRLLDHVDPPVSPLWDSSVSMSSMAASDDSTVQRR